MNKTTTGILAFGIAGTALLAILAVVLVIASSADEPTTSTSSPTTSSTRAATSSRPTTRPQASQPTVEPSRPQPPSRQPSRPTTRPQPTTRPPTSQPTVEPPSSPQGEAALTTIEKLAGIYQPPQPLTKAAESRLHAAAWAFLVQHANDPKSMERIASATWVQGKDGGAQIRIQYRGRNAFGAMAFQEAFVYVNAGGQAEWAYAP